ncbi:MAG: hypothetical protein KatS3mg055_2360 [Chloroflexus sp.]|uniref:hypothetical protein n=1 Tax=Chloroflexus sp. TaxID=1904827 RepID=UPI0021DD2468|nr:hypothetical protein [Chloroflexus sp.]GIV89842.1 MAG: hypothetical protein KatS3mg055_2360 [Chloroflexus sp.]
MSSLLRNPRQLIAVLIAGVSGLIVLLDFVGSGPVVKALAMVLVQWAALITALAVVIGAVSVFSAHLRRVRARAPEAGYSLVLIIGMVIVIVAGIFYPTRTATGLTLPMTLAAPPIRTVFRLIYEPLAASLLALLAFFALSAMLRALRSGRTEAIVVVSIALLALVIQLPPLTFIPFIGQMVQWLNDYLVAAGARGLLLGSAIGALIAGVRLLIGFDMPYADR